MLFALEKKSIMEPKNYAESCQSGFIGFPTDKICWFRNKGHVVNGFLQLAETIRKTSVSKLERGCQESSQICILNLQFKRPLLIMQLYCFLFVFKMFSLKEILTSETRQDISIMQKL